MEAHDSFRHNRCTFFRTSKRYSYTLYPRVRHQKKSLQIHVVQQSLPRLQLRLVLFQ